MSTNRGYLKTDGSAKRLRFVKAGYDATDETVPPNQVIFDSKDLATLSILDTGTFSWFNTTGTGGQVKVASFNYGFVPLCTFQWDYFNNNHWSHALNVQTATGLGPLVRVALDGIYINMYWGATAPKVTVRWQIYRIKAA